MNASALYTIGLGSLTLEDFATLLAPGTQITLAPEVQERVETAQHYLQQRLETADRPLYGINTGFGALCNTVIPPEQLVQLQRNLLLSHACGTGETVPPAVVRAMLLLKITGLSKGHSGISSGTLQRLMDFYNADVLPVVFERGSLGASGDLAPLAHLALPLIGEGEVWLEGTRCAATELQTRFGWRPLQLGPKEGLALLNGTQFMSGYVLHCLLHLQRLLNWADSIAALSLDAFRCRLEPFHELLQQVRPHPGQVAVARNIRSLLQDSPIANRPKTQVQDPYSFRCVPQVHGAIRDAVSYAETTCLREANCVTDNPNVFVAEDQILAGGNFHGQAIALATDHLVLAACQLGAIAERRVYQLQSGTRDLPPFLAVEPGVHSGFMILQYTAAGLVNEMKHLAQPQSHDSIPSCNGQEDFVSMGANVAVKLYKQLDHLQTVLAIELLHAAQALDFRRQREDLLTAPRLQELLEIFRQQVPFASEDRIFHYDIEKAKTFLQETAPPL